MSPERDNERKQPDLPIFIGNSGLALLSPYLLRFFERLDLITSSDSGSPRITGSEAQSRAVNLLQYMADGRTDAPEPELVLNKLLAGVAISQPIEPNIDPIASDLEVCDDLLHAVTANWRIISGASTAALRETFLQREGRLRHGDEKWELTVERKTVDVLIDQIPWSYSTIYHHWMPEPLFVTW